MAVDGPSEVPSCAAFQEARKGILTRHTNQSIDAERLSLCPGIIGDTMEIGIGWCYVRGSFSLWGAVAHSNVHNSGMFVIWCSRAALLISTIRQDLGECAFGASQFWALFRGPQSDDSVSFIYRSVFSPSNALFEHSKIRFRSPISVFHACCSLPAARKTPANWIQYRTLIRRHEDILRQNEDFQTRS